MMQVFEQKMKELHDFQFVHGDFMRPTNYFTRGNREWMFGNILQTETGLRLIDAGFSKVYNKENAEEYVHILIRERDEILVFKDYYLS
jgi:tRNA A-37 threonylcarbamoyl transferase component Bud32